MRMTAPPEPLIERISLKEAVKLAGGKPEKGFTRNDLLVSGGWLSSRWGWSHDIDIPLDKAIESSRRIGEQVKIVGGSAEKRNSGGWGSLFAKKNSGKTPTQSGKNVHA